MGSDEVRVQAAADPSWPLKIDHREAVLWIGPSLARLSAEAPAADTLANLLRYRWAAVYVDLPKQSIKDLLPDLHEFGGLVPRLFDQEVPPSLGANRLPIYGLRGPGGLVGPRCSDDPELYFTRLGMLKLLDRDISAGYELFALGIANEKDLEGLVEAIQVSVSLKRIVVVNPELLDLTPLRGRGLDRLILWRAAWPDVLALLEQSTRIGGSSGEVLVRIRTSGDKGASKKPLAITHCIDPSYPITGRFDLITEAEFRTDRPPPFDDQSRAFLVDPSGSWEPYSIGIPYSRHTPYLQALLKQLRLFAHQGHSQSMTAWFQAEDGSGVTTALRQICFDVAREGYPVLVARHDVDRFDFRQISVFLREVSDVMVEEGIRVSEVPWIIAFDAEHVEICREFVSGLCNGLKNLMRSVVVLAVRPWSETSLRAMGTERYLTEHPLANTVTVDEGMNLGKHLKKYLPDMAKRTRNQWEAYIQDTVRIGIEGPRSLFWVALRFWLNRVAGVDESLRHWLSTKFESVAAARAEAYAGLLEVAVLAKHRLVTPTSLLSAECLEPVRQISLDSTNSIGLRRIRFGKATCLTYAHPLIAEELLRIAMGQQQVLNAVEADSCLSPLHLELHLFGRLIARPAAGNAECIPIMEDLVTSVLRVDQREAPRNWQVRDQIVSLLEYAPSTLWDNSPVFNHHMAKARRNLAAFPPSPEWTTEMRREQLELAENHLEDALYYLKPADEERRESPLNLHVSLALTCDVRSRLEEEAGILDKAEAYRSKSEQQYMTAMKLDADNSYVLENFSRYKLRVARKLPQSAERTKLLVEAVAMLESERRSQTSDRRDEPILQELACAYDLLREGDGERFLMVQAASGLEVALVGLSVLLIRAEGSEPTSDALDRAEQYLERVKPADVTWRSRLPLYRLVSQRHPYDFPRRLEIMEELKLDRDFQWPLQSNLEYGILLFQAGDPQRRQEGAKIFKDVRTELFERDRSTDIHVPDELRYLRDPCSNYKTLLLTSIRVKNTSSTGRSCYGIPVGWGTIDVQFFAHRFPRDRILPGDELDCLIQFTNFGPQAVPRSEGDDQ